MTKETLVFNEEEHTYHVGEQELTSVTKFVSWFFPEFDQETISRRVAQKRGVTQQEILDEWTEISSKGTLVHEEIENFVLGNINITHNKSLQGVKFCEKMVTDTRVKLVPEWRIHSSKLRLAGTIDLYCKGLKDGLSFIYDWKTNDKLSEQGYGYGVKESTKHIPNSKLHKYYLQLNTYAYILKKEHNIILEDMIIVHLKDDSFRGIIVPDMQEDVKNMIKEWRENEDDKRIN